MRRGSVLQAKQQFYDRSPAIINLNFSSAALAPHAITTRASYTVPAGRKAILNSSSLRIERITAAAPQGLAQVMLIVNNLTVNVLVDLCRTQVNTLNVVETGRNSHQIVLTAGQQVLMQTQDASTGGTIQYDGMTALTEFDA